MQFQSQKAFNNGSYFPNTLNGNIY